MREVCSRSLWRGNGLPLFKGVCKPKVCLLWPGGVYKLLVCYIYIFLRLFLMFKHAVIYQGEPHGISSLPGKIIERLTFTFLFFFLTQPGARPGQVLGTNKHICLNITLRHGNLF